MTINQNDLLMQPGQGASYWFDRDLYTFKAVGEDTGEAYALMVKKLAYSSGDNQVLSIRTIKQSD
jgi:hypothetical protein